MYKHNHTLLTFKKSKITTINRHKTIVRFILSLGYGPGAMLLLRPVGLTFTLKWALPFPGVATQHWKEAHTCHGSCWHPIHHTAPSSWEESKRILGLCAIAAMGAKEKEPGVNWDHLKWLQRPPSYAISSQGSRGWLLQGQPQPHSCRGMTCWQVRKISHLRLQHKADSKLLNKMLKHKVTLNSYEFVTLWITPGGLAVLLHLPRTHGF